MRFTLCLVAILSCVAACRAVKYSPNGDERSYLRTDSSMTVHENPANKSSTGVGIPGY